MTAVVATLVAAGALLLAATVLATAASAFDRLTLPAAQRMVDDGVAGAHELVAVLRVGAPAVAALALLTTLARAGFVVLVVWTVVGVTGGTVAIVVATIAAAALLYVVADALPALLVARRRERVAVVLSRLVGRPVTLLVPVAGLLGRPLARLDRPPPDAPADETEVMRERLRDLIDAAALDASLNTSERAMLSAVLELGDTVVREIMVPRPDMVVVSDRHDLRRVVEVVLRAGYTRVLVHGDDRDDIRGVIYAKDLLALLHRGGQRPWTELVRPPLVVPELMNVESLLRDLQQRQVHLAVVVDEYGATVGLVTIEDVLEELVGEIADEYDHELPLVEPLAEDRWRVDARLPVDELAELVGVKLPTDEWDTVGGLVFGMLGHIAVPGDRVSVDGVDLVTEAVRGRRISKVLVSRTATDGKPDDDG